MENQTNATKRLFASHSVTQLGWITVYVMQINANNMDVGVRNKTQDYKPYKKPCARLSLNANLGIVNFVNADDDYRKPKTTTMKMKIMDDVVCHHVQDKMV